ncbi:class I SAM-dependent methyltransferase [Candidatus Wolfebacteria bacterium]|nr:class I SAM-dependent methyltransferase [Candidatus Wolfebacteria bacterium]
MDNKEGKQSTAHHDLTVEEVQKYWSGKNVPQQWYSKREPFTLAWFNELRYKRFNVYYEYLKEGVEYAYHSGEQVLEVGCGIGTDLAEFARNGAIVTGVDLGEDQVRLTKLNFQLQNLPFREIRQANAEHLPFPDNSFDLVVSLGVLHHTPDTELAITEVHRVLKSDGKAILVFYSRGWKHYIKRCFVTGILRGRWFKYGFDWQKVYDEASEVHGFAPKTGVYTKRQVRKMFHLFPTINLEKKRMGEFFEYKPYNTYKFPKFVNNFCRFFNFEGLLGENWLIKVAKYQSPKEDSLKNVIFKHY